MQWRDRSGRRLSDYPHPSVAVDVALLTLVWQERRGQLAVLVHQRDDGAWSLPGTFLRMQERLHEAALRALRDKVGVTGESPRQLCVFDDPDRDFRGRVLSVAHVDLVPVHRLADRVGGTVALAPLVGDPAHVQLPDGGGRLTFDHDQVVEHAVQWARVAYDAQPDPSHLLGEQFTLYQLRRVHEAVLGPDTPQKDTFRRRMEAQLVETESWSSGSVGRPARLFRRAGGEGSGARMRRLRSWTTDRS